MCVPEARQSRVSLAALHRLLVIFSDHGKDCSQEATEKIRLSVRPKTICRFTASNSRNSLYVHALDVRIHHYVRACSDSSELDLLLSDKQRGRSGEREKEIESVYNALLPEFCPQ